MKTYIAAAMLFIAAPAWPQGLTAKEMPAALPGSGVSDGEEVSDRQDDPGQGLYKEGYDAILAEQWADARKSFSKLISKYPNSFYVRDAQYWSAYAQSHLDKKKALSEYQSFINTNAGGRYYSDAIADMANLQAELALNLSQTNLDSILRRLNVPSPAPAPNAGVSFNPQTFSRAMARFGKRMALFGKRFSGVGNAEEEDPTLRLKLQALSAIGEGEEDDQSYATLKDIAEDRQQPHQLRMESLEQLSNYEHHPVLPVYMEIIKNDTSEEMRTCAIENIAESIKDKDSSASTLQDLYMAAPASNTDLKGTILYYIADVGNDNAVAFLTHVAKTDSEYEMREDAIYYLGSIGGTNARKALYDILKTK